MVEEAPGKSDGNEGISRRKFTLGVLLASLAGAVGSLFAMLKVVTPAKTSGGYTASIQPGDILVYAEGANAGSAVTASSMKAGDAVLVYPSGKSSNPANLVQLIRLDEKAFKPPTDISFTDKGFAAYSAICTHLGCTVSWARNAQAPDASVAECHCHGSIFNPAEGAKVMGGPAPIPLSQIGVKVKDDGTLAFTGGFNGPVGPQV